MKKQSKVYYNFQNSGTTTKLQSQTLIGKGSFAQVYKVVENGETYVKKKIPKLLIVRQGRQQQLNRQIQAIKKTNHENIIKFISYQQNDPKYFIIKMQYCEGQNLRNYLLENYQKLQKIFPSKQYFPIKVCLDYINALTQIRSKMIANRDIKPDNIIIKIDSNNKIIAKMIDFGQAKFNIKQSMTHVGTHGYMAPQIYFKNRNYSGQMSDLWSLGLTIYQIFEGVRVDSNGQKYIGCPFQQKFNPHSQSDFKQYYQKLIHNEIILSKSKTTKPFRQIIYGLLRPDPAMRLNFSQVLQILYENFNQLQSELYAQQAQYQKNRLVKCISMQKQTIYRAKQSKMHLQICIMAIDLYKKLYPQVLYYQQNFEFINLLINLIVQIKFNINQMVKQLQIDKDIIIEQILNGQITLQQYNKINQNLQKYIKLLGKNSKHQFNGLNEKLKNIFKQIFKNDTQQIIKKIEKVFSSNS